MATLIVCNWHTECGSCGYGHGGYMSARKDGHLPPLGPDSKVCHGCGEEFTSVERVLTS